MASRDSAKTTGLGPTAMGQDDKERQISPGCLASASLLLFQEYPGSPHEVMLAHFKDTLVQNPQLDCGGGGEKGDVEQRGKMHPSPQAPLCHVVVATQAVLDFEQQEGGHLCLHLAGGQQDVDGIHGQGVVIQEDFCSSQATSLVITLPLLVENPPHCSLHLTGRDN